MAQGKEGVIEEKRDFPLCLHLEGAARASSLSVNVYFMLFCFTLIPYITASPENLFLIHLSIASSTRGHILHLPNVIFVSLYNG